MLAIVYSILVLLAVATLCAGQCPAVNAPCYCVPSVYEPVSIVCDNAPSLTAVISAINSARSVQIDVLVITNTQIPVLPPNAFLGFTITRLVLNQNQMGDISPGAFEGSIKESLLELDLRQNLLGRVPQNGVSQLTRLNKLALARNRIRQLLPQSFANYASKTYLRKIDLSANQLSTVEPTLFYGLSNLEEVSLQGNSLTYIPTVAFRDQRTILKNLNLGSNQINSVPIDSLNFPALESLSLEFNLLSNIAPEAFRGIPSLLSLYLTGNRFNQWYPDMFRYVGSLRNLGMGEMPITRIQSNAFQYIPSLVKLEMSEAAVNTIDVGAFQKTPHIQAVILDKNRLSRIRGDMFRGLAKLNTLNLAGNKLNDVDDGAFASLPGLRNLDISNNNLKVIYPDTFSGTFLPTPEARVLYLCENPWACNQSLAWFRQWLRDNPSIIIDKQNCLAVCRSPEYLLELPLRSEDYLPTSSHSPTVSPEPYSPLGMPTLGWIILAVILAILLTSIFLLAIVRYFVSRKHKEQKDLIDEQRILSSAASGYNPGSMVGTANPGSAVDLDLPPATTLEERRTYWDY
ncbi:unnamed protein product [Soboliphyme baturini]|uniref:LRRCT domain-containing protein n=1 Tax=Soboliphyme baturini TaxID=241478 RepID=A0A183IL04_9BILA|nr:unnamed protein product [Soboliphyme baturini]